MADSTVVLNLLENGFQLAEVSFDKQFEVHSLGYGQTESSILDASTEDVMQSHAKKIEEYLNKLQIKKRNLNVILPDSVSYSQILQMPKLKEKELLSAIKYQADQFIPMPIEQTAIDLEILHEDKVSKNVLVLIVASPQTIISKVENIIGMAGCIPELVENELSSTSRFIAQLYKPKQQNSGTFFINFGTTSTSLYFYHQGYGLVVDSHIFKLGKNLFTRDLQANTTFDLKKVNDILKRIGLGQEGSFNFDELLRPVFMEWFKEIEKFVRSMKEKHKIEVIEGMFLFNHAVDIHDIDKKLESQIAIPTRVLDMTSFIKKTPLTDSFGRDLSSFVTTFGGCLR